MSKYIIWCQTPEHGVSNMSAWEDAMDAVRECDSLTQYDPLTFYYITSNGIPVYYSENLHTRAWKNIDWR